MTNRESPAPVRAVRIPDDMWQELTEWSVRCGLGNSEALRKMLRLHLDTRAPEVVVDKPTAWMTKLTPPPGKWVLCSISGGAAWMTLDDILREVSGVHPVHPVSSDTPPRYPWYRVQRSQAQALAELFSGHTRRLKFRSYR
jgi:hypothetical protein